MSALPSGWVEATLGTVAKVEWGNTSLTKKTYMEEGYTAFSAAGPDGFVSKPEHQGAGIVLSAIGAGCGRCFKADGEWTAIKNTMTMTECLAERDYLFSFLNNPERWPKKGGAQPFIALGDARLVPVPLPPLAEQKRIVAKLDALDAKSACARTELARIETLVSRYKQAVLSKAFSGELTAHLREPSIDLIQATISDPFTHTQSAPASWTRHLFSEVCTIVGGSQPPKTTFAYTPQDGYVRLVQIRDYKSDAKATYIPKALARRFCSSTDIMIGRYGPPIFQILRGIEGAYNVALMKAEPTEAVAREFLYWYLHHPVLFKYVEIDSKRTAGQDGVNKAHLERWPILLPPLEEQHEIVRRIESAFAKIDRLAKEAKRALELVGRLDEAILAKAFRGELVPQDENDEPAEHLLARIRTEREAAPKGKRGRGAKG